MEKPCEPVLPASHRFLENGGETAALIARHPWSQTSLGPINDWPQSLRALVGAIIRSPAPMTLLWGPDGVLIYNDGYAGIAGARHPGILGTKARESWPEAAAFNDHVIRTVLAGQTLTFRDQYFELDRSGTPEPVWLTLDYSPVLDDDARPAGVLAVVAETTEKVRAANRLAAERERLKQMFEQAPTFMVLLDGPEHRIEFANPGYMRLIGDRPVLGMTVAEALPDAVEQGYLDLLDRVFRTGRSYTARGSKYHMQTEPGGPIEKKYVDFVFQPISDPQGRVLGIFVEGVDVTDKMAAEEALRNSERDLRLGLEAGGIGTWTIDAATGHLTSSALFRRLLGRDPDAPFTLADLQSAFHPEDRHDVRQALDRAIRSRAAFDIECRIFTAIGELQWIQLRSDPVRDEPAGSALAGLCSNITGRKRAELRREAFLRLSDEFRRLDDTDAIAHAAARTLGEMLSVSRVGYGTMDSATGTMQVEKDWTAPGVDTLAGRTPLRDYGTFVEDLTRGNFVSIADVMLDPRTRATADALIARSARSFVNVPVVEKDGLVAILYLNDVNVRAWSADEVTLIRDVAERTRSAVERLRGEAALRDSEARLREANESLEAKVDARTRELGRAEEALRQAQKMEAVGQLTGGIAHDFNNLLAGITGSLEVLEKRLARGRFDGAERYIGMARGSARRAAALTQRLLAFSRRQTLAPRPTDLNRLIGGMEDLIRRSVGPDIVVEVVGAGGLWTTRIDASQLESSLLNLCINARDAMAPGGGRLTIETANKWLDDRAAGDRELPPGQYVSLCVTDTGTGMSPDVIARAFDPFFTTKPLGEGTGLGLSMVYGFVRQSGGQVRIYSEPGRGTTMCLYLPRHVGEADAPEDGQPPEPDAGAGETVLVIDDEPTIRLLIVEVLNESGYRTLEAGDGAAGLRILDSSVRVDLLITDVGLPGGLNGRQVADAARVRRPGLKVLFVTGFAENAAVGHGHLEPGMDVMAKPFAMSAMAAKVAEMIER